MAKRNKKPRDRRGPPKGQPITQEILKQNADALARVWLLLKKDKPELTSDAFWKLLKKRWDLADLTEALDNFTRKDSAKNFREILIVLPKRKSPGYWSDWEKFTTELQSIIHDFGNFPSSEELRELGRGDLVRAAYRYFGGMQSVREKLGHSAARKAIGYWQNEDNILNALKKVVGELQHFPTMSELKKRGQSGLAKVMSMNGGFSKYAKLLAHEPTEKTKGYYQDFENVRADLLKIQQEFGHFPSCWELQKKGHTSLVSAIYKYHGGFRKVRSRLGEKPAIKRNGHWDNFSNVEKEIRSWIKSHHSFPSQRKLLREGRSVLVYAIKRHGGFAKVRARMCYGPVTQDLLVANADDLAKVYLQLKKQQIKTTSGELWRAIKARWCEQDLRNAIEAFKKRRSLTAFKKLLA